MLEAIFEHLPGQVQVHPPAGGLFIWMRLPEGISAQSLLPFASQAGVTYAPGGWFSAVPGEGDDHLRLNFAVQPPENINEGIRRLGAAIRQLQKRSGA